MGGEICPKWNSPPSLLHLGTGESMQVKGRERQLFKKSKSKKKDSMMKCKFS